MPGGPLGNASMATSGLLAHAAPHTDTITKQLARIIGPPRIGLGQLRGTCSPCGVYPGLQAGERGRLPGDPAGRLLVGVGELQAAWLVVRAADDLDPGRQPG